jgi:hypothetical protein
MRENIEVHGSHCGLCYNPPAVYAVADRLAQPEHDWQPFRPPSMLRQHFPPPVHWPLSPSPAPGDAEGLVSSRT